MFTDAGDEERVREGTSLGCMCGEDSSVARHTEGERENTGEGMRRVVGRVRLGRSCVSFSTALSTLSSSSSSSSSQGETGR
jgi:hypothetical protein